MLRLVAIAAALDGLTAQAADGQTIAARVVGVHDGDTLTAPTGDRRYDHTAALDAAERNARAARRGLWADGDAVPPREWRTGKRKATEVAI
jgi:endonuclease YncB( thermonuclease family)